MIKFVAVLAMYAAAAVAIVIAGLIDLPVRWARRRWRKRGAQ